MPNPLKLVKVDLTRVTRLQLLVPADMDEDRIARAVECYYDGSTMYGDGEVDGDVVLYDDDSTSNDAEIAESEPADEVDANTVRAVQEYWNWIAQQVEANP